MVELLVELLEELVPSVRGRLWLSLLMDFD